ncbi:MAG: UbiA family prenyltransferase [Rhodobacteraceae bacterium]|nr:MAG: UbiA family prenyltransferase [Paracoccaceae bacterium]
MDELSPTEDPSIALVVDLDGTLSRTDTLHEALLGLATREPLALLKLPLWLSEGRAELKAHLVDRGVVDPETLPMSPGVIAMVTAAREEGRPTALVSAADHRQVTAVAEATGLFDEAYGSAEGLNLKGTEKAAFLTNRYGPAGFDYLGDSAADAPVWKAARRAITVGASRRVRQVAEGANPAAHHVEPPEGRAWAMLRAMRPHQWSKNLLLFLPVLAAQDLGSFPTVLIAFVAFCLTASAVYVINDLLDLPADRAHPRKRNRPFAAGDLSAVTGIAMAAVFLLVALILTLIVGTPRFIALIGIYFGLTFLYSLWLKRELLIDVVTLAGLYTIRIGAGAAAAPVTLSPWLMGFSMFLFLCLAAVKRQAELTDQIETGRTSSGRAYQTEDLPVLRGIAISAGNTAVLVLALYISSDNFQGLYSDPGYLWLICPVMLYWCMRMVMKAHRGQMTDDPIVFAITDKLSLAAIAASAAILIAAI